MTAGALAIARKWLDTDNSMSPEELSEMYKSFVTAQRRPRNPQPDIGQK